MPTKEVCIYAPSSMTASVGVPALDRAFGRADYLAWRWNALGQVIKPNVDAFRSDWTWCWFASYTQAPEPSVPLEFVENQSSRFVKLRVQIEDQNRYQQFQDAVNLSAKQHGFWASGDQQGNWPNYDLEADLGKTRYSIDRAPTRVTERATRMVTFLCASCELVLDTLTPVQGGGGFVPELIPDDNNQYRNYLESVHHLFCNATDVPLASVTLRAPDGREVVVGWTYVGHYLNEGFEVKRLDRVQF